MNDRAYLRTIDLARAVGLSAQMVRNYERDGFLPPAQRAPNGYRLYTTRHLHALQVARALIVGFGWQRARAIMGTVHHRDLPGVAALIDEWHSLLHRQRQETTQLLEVLRTLSTNQRAPALPIAPSGRRRTLSVGQVARQLGVRSSAIRFWENQGLVAPARDRSSGYRYYTEEQVRQLEVVALLRQGGYNFMMIRAVLEQLAAGKPEQMIALAEQRLHELALSSLRCLEAQAAFWGYVTAQGVLGMDTTLPERL